MWSRAVTQLSGEAVDIRPVLGFFVMMSVVRHVIVDAPFGFIFGTRSETQKHFLLRESTVLEYYA